MDSASSVHGQWSSRFAYVLAATGAAVGLGNIWKFPYIMGENGGGAFVLVYLLCILLIGIPVMMAEVLIGKAARKSPGKAVEALAVSSGHSANWKYVGWMGVWAGYLILSFYVVIAGWALAYIFYSGQGAFTHRTSEEITALFGALVSEPRTLMFWSFLIIAGTVIVVGKGVQKGLERAVSYMMPALLLLLFVMAGYAVVNGSPVEAFNFMFKPDFSKLTVNGVVVALGHAFFSLSLASGIMTMFGAYLPESTSIAKSSVWIAIADTMVALVAGIAIFPIVFANGMAPEAGPGLIFQALPVAFSQMPAGQLFGTLFFIMLVFAAFTSSIALIESSVAWLVEHHAMSRWAAAALSGGGIWLLSIGTSYSFAEGSWAHFSIGTIQTTYFELLDYLTANIMLPIGGALLAIFVGWMMKTAVLSKMITEPAVLRLWKITLRYVTPLAIIFVFLNLVGVITL